METSRHWPKYLYIKKSSEYNQNPLPAFTQAVSLVTVKGPVNGSVGELKTTTENTLVPGGKFDKSTVVGLGPPSTGSVYKETENQRFELLDILLLTPLSVTFDGK